MLHAVVGDGVFAVQGQDQPPPAEDVRRGPGHAERGEDGVCPPVHHRLHRRQGIAQARGGAVAGPVHGHHQGLAVRGEDVVQAALGVAGGGGRCGGRLGGARRCLGAGPLCRYGHRLSSCPCRVSPHRVSSHRALVLPGLPTPRAWASHSVPGPVPACPHACPHACPQTGHETGCQGMPARVAQKPLQVLTCPDRPCNVATRYRSNPDRTRAPRGRYASPGLRGWNRPPARQVRPAVSCGVSRPAPNTRWCTDEVYVPTEWRGWEGDHARRIRPPLRSPVGVCRLRAAGGGPAVARRPWFAVRGVAPTGAPEAAALSGSPGGSGKRGFR